MTKKLFIGGLSWDTGDAQLKAAFETFGTVASASVVLDKETGRSRGFGFVEFATEDEARRAQLEMDGADLDGRSIRVSQAQERERSPRPPDRGGDRAPRGEGGGERTRQFRDAPARPKSARGGRKPGESKGHDRFARKRNVRSRRRDEGGGGYDDTDY